MSLVFISYAHEDRAAVDALIAVLDECRVTHFLDAKDIGWGASISARVGAALDEALAVLVVLSPASLQSQWVPFEVGVGCALQKRILPFLTDPDLKVPGYLGDRRYLTSLDDVREFFLDPQALPRSVSTPASDAGSHENVASKLVRVMPELIAEMKNDVLTEGSELIREFVVLPNKRVSFWHSKKRFVYFEDEHSDLQNKVDLLEQYGLVADVTPGNTPIYRMDESFVEWLTSGDLEAA